MLSLLSQVKDSLQKKANRQKLQTKNKRKNNLPKRKTLWRPLLKRWKFCATNICVLLLSLTITASAL